MKTPNDYGLGVKVTERKENDPPMYGVEMPDGNIVWSYVGSAQRAVDETIGFLKRTYGEDYNIKTHKVE